MVLWPKYKKFKNLTFFCSKQLAKVHVSNVYFGVSGHFVLKNLPLKFDEICMLLKFIYS